MEASGDSKHGGSARKGKAVEHLIAASCILASGGELNASTSLVDDEGVDIVFHRRGRSRTLAVQVKSRLDEEGGSKHLYEKRQFLGDVRVVTFQPRDNLYLLFVAVSLRRRGLRPGVVRAESRLRCDGAEHRRLSSEDTTHNGFREAGYARPMAEVPT